MSKIMIFTPSLNIGGIERVMLTYAAGLIRRGHTIKYVTCAAGWGDYRELLPDGAVFFNLGTARVRNSIGALAKLLKKERPDMVLTANEPTMIVFLAKLISGVKTTLITSQHSYLGNVESTRIHPYIVKYIYPRCHKVIAVSRGIAAMLVDRLGVPAHKVQTIYNPLDMDTIQKSAKEEIDLTSEYILFAGRLDLVKNLCLLIDAFHIFSKTHPRVKLLIMGDGTERDKLKKYAEDKYPQSMITFIGKKINPYPYIAHARAVCLSSSSEALPTILMESMFLGRTCVSTPTLGANDILHDGEYGYISESFDDASDYARQLEMAYDNPKDDGMLRQAAVKSYGLDEKITTLEALLQ